MVEKVKVHNKLVRDRIPELLSGRGLMCRTRVLTDQEAFSALTDKLQEEVAEYLCSQTSQERLEELADVVEVIFALLRVQGSTFHDLELRREEKFRDRGGFSRMIFLEETLSAGSS